MKFESVSHLKVGLRFGDETLPVGTLSVPSRERAWEIFFECDPSFLARGLEISPVSWPLKAGTQELARSERGRLLGVFADSLPDYWGKLLLTHELYDLGGSIGDLSILDRLACVGTTGMGALVYEPERLQNMRGQTLDLDALANQIREILAGYEGEGYASRLRSLSGGSGGARPKAVIGVHPKRRDVIYRARKLPVPYEPWLVKFPGRTDEIDIGAMEYVYALMAKDAGLVMPEVHLFEAAKGPGYFAVRRFDRDQSKRLHMHTAARLLHKDPAALDLDYKRLLEVTMQLTRDVREVEKNFRLAVLNVFAHNRDDHGLNFSFLMDEDGTWAAAPAYDLTFSLGYGGEHATTVMGEGRNPGVEHLTRLGKEMSLPQRTIDDAIERTQAAVSRWPALAKEYGVDRKTISIIRKALGV